MFGDDPAPAAPQEALAPDLIADWQVKQLRELLDVQGLTSQAERQAAIEAAAGHPVASLKALTRQEAMVVAERLSQTSASSGSSWDEREDDTWIDNL